MSLLSRNTGGGRRVATMATVFVGTLLTYLVLTAVPAMAVTTCASATVDVANDKLDIDVGADDRVIIRATATEWEISVNEGAFDVCPATATVAAVDWIEVTGSDAGNETVRAYAPGGAFAAINTTVDLGNGTDTFIFQYAAVTTPALVDAGNAALGLGLAADGTINGGQPVGGAADFRIDDAENIVVNGSDTLGAGDVVNLSDDGQSGFSVVTGTADDTQATVAPVDQGVTFNAGSGDDTLVSGDGADNFQGGPGVDTIDYTGSSVGVTADLTAATGTGQGNDTLVDVQNVSGSDFDDIITGNALDNVLTGNDGDDVISGGAGNDTVSGGDDDDTLLGGAGTDTVSGDLGDDVIDEEAAANGDDTFTGGGGFDELNYGARTTNTVVIAGGVDNSGQDANNDGDASDTGDERDSVGGDIERFVTGSGNDILEGDGSDEEFAPGAGDDDVDGNGGTADMLDQSEATAAVTVNIETGTSTGLGTDTFEDIETFATGAGDDVVIPDNETGLPALFDWFAGDGIDTIDGSTNTSGFTVDLSVLGDPDPVGPPVGCSVTPPALPNVGGGTCIVVENATGGSGNDALTGNPISNVLLGNAGLDTLAADGGNDFVEGGAGNDSLAGGSGADFLSYVNAPSGEVIDMQLGFASGGDGDDAIGFFEIVLGSDFGDEITGGQTSLDANLRVRGRGGNDLITGTNSSDTLAGGGGNDVIRGGGGDDIVRGAAGNDRLFGSSGDDFLFGGRGTDVGRGGAGNDICRGIEDRRSC